MSCTFDGINVPQRAGKAIDELAKGNDKQAIRLLEIYKSTAFREFVSKDKLVSEKGYVFDDIPSPTMRRLLKHYVDYNRINVAKSVMPNVNKQYTGFTTASAVGVAKQFTVDSLVNSMFTTLKSGGDINNINGLLSKTNTFIIKNFTAVYNKSLTSPNDGYKIKELAPVRADFENDSAYNIAKEKYNNRLLLNVADWVINNSADSKLVNLASTVYQIVANGTEWYNDVRRNPKVNFLFANIDNDSNVEWSKYEANTLYEENTDGSRDDQVDESTKAWTLNIGEINNFIDHIDTFMRAYLQNLPEIVSATPVNDKFAVDKNNELGVRLNVSYSTYAAAIYQYGDFSNPTRLIESLNKTANTLEGLKSLAIVARDMRNNTVLANAIYNNFAKPIISKAILTVSDGNFTLRQSNFASNPEAQLQFNFLNSLKSTAINTASDNIIDGLSELNTNEIKNFKNDGTETNLERKNKIVNEFYNIAKTYFPDISKYAISAYINDGDIKRNMSNLYRALMDVSNGADKVYNEYTRRKIENNKIWRRNREAEEVGAELEPYKTYDTEYVDVARGDVIRIANMLLPYTAVKTELNSYNAEGNLSSDVINQNYIASIQQHLNNPDALKEFMNFKTKGQFYNFSNILYEHNTPGGKIYGLFRKDSNGNVAPTSYAKDLLKTYLFAGAVDNNSGENALYTGMSAADYFITSVQAFTQSINLQQNYNEAGITFGTYFMRTPSDAPKNFMISAPRYNSRGLIDVDREAIYNKLTPIINEQINSKYIDNINDLDIEYYFNDMSFSSVIPDQNMVDNNTFVGLITGSIKEFDVTNLQKSDTGGYYVFNTIGDNTYGMQINDNSENRVINIFPVFGSTKSNKTELINFVEDNAVEAELESNSYDIKVNEKHVLFNAYKNILKGEIQNALTAFNKMFKYNGKSIVLNKKRGQSDADFLRSFQDRYYYNGEALKDGKPTGNVFILDKLFAVNGYDVNAAMADTMSILYGEFAKAESAVIRVDGKGNVNVDFNNIDKVLNEVVSNWVKNLEQYSNNMFKDTYKSVADGITSDQVFDYVANSYLTNVWYDDLYEGDTKFYKKGQDFLKRAKEVQASGTPYSADRSEAMGLSIVTGETPISISDNYSILDKNGFKAITIKNTIRLSDNADSIYNQLIDAGVDKNNAAFIAAGYGRSEVVVDKNGEIVYEDKAKKKPKFKYEGADTTVNDAQSYITLEEFARRRFKDGTLDQYKDLLEMLNNPDLDIKTIDPRKLKAFIQVQKNFYYDMQFDEDKQIHYPRQIKNAEYVLIPAFIKGTDLEKVNDWMTRNGIDQLNTVETTKAAKKNVITLWDNNGVLGKLDDKFDKLTQQSKEDYYYQYLYKQQDVPQHITDAKNKAGIQIMKKILDNIPAKYEGLRQELFNSYVANIKESFNNLAEEFGITYNSDGTINVDNINFENIYNRFAEESARLGLDSNLLDYSRYVDGKTIMPNYMNLVSSKIESIAQSYINSRITRQKLPGWHAAQITSVGYGGYILDKAGNKLRKLEYHPAVTDKNGKIVQQAYAEVLLPKWASTMFNQYDKDGNLVKEISIEDVDNDVLTSIGYRIPTEGKQSISILKVVGFLPEAEGSTIVVPDEWVTQTGSDFDVDSVYGISYETYLGSDGKVHKINYLDDDNSNIRQRYINYAKRNGVKVEFEKVDINRKDIRKKLKLKIKGANEDILSKLNDTFDALMEQEQEVWEALPNEDKEFVKKHHSDTKGLISFTESNNDLIRYFNNKANQVNNDNVANVYKQIANLYEAINEQVRLFNDANYEISQAAYDAVPDEIKKLIDVNRNAYLNAVESAAKEANLLSVEDFSKLPVEEQNSDKARNNHILDTMIKIMNLKESREENYSRSNFEALTNANKFVNTLDPTSRGIRSPYNPFDQIANMEDAMSGAKLKAFSVTRDTFNSVNNVAQTTMKADYTIRIAYDNTNKEYNLKAIEESYGKENVEEKDGIIYVKHNKLAWSNDNRNVVGQLITPYSSQTTAHILDAIKEGAVKNENDYTFAAFKTLVDVGTDYKTAIMFLRQPGMSRIVQAYNENKSIYVSGSFDPIQAAVKSIAVELGLTTEYKGKTKAITKFTNINTVIKAINAHFNTDFSINSKNKLGVNIDQRELLNGFKNTGEDALLSELKTIFEFNKLNEIANNITNIARVCNPDNFGAKQTIFATNNVLENIERFVNDTGIANSFIAKNGKNILDAIYPDISKGEEIFNTKSLKESVYPSLAAFLKYSTIPSITINSALFNVTESPQFVRFIKGISYYTNTTLNEQTYNDFKKYVIGNVYSGIDFIKYPVVQSSTGSEIVRQDDNGVIDTQTELDRIYGYYNSPNISFAPTNLNDINTKNIDEFYSLSPAQKVQWIKSNSDGSENIFDYIDVNLHNNYVSRNGVSPQTIYFNDNAIDRENAYELFKTAYYNTNPYVRLAAIDVIKYAFAAEGYQFRNRSVSKIIPNDVLLDKAYEGRSIIDMIDNDMQDVQNRISTTIYDDYIRSHYKNKNLVKNTRIKKIGGAFEDSKYRILKGHNMFAFDRSNYSDYQFLSKIGVIYNDGPSEFVNRYVSTTKRTMRNGKPIDTTTLYAIVERGKQIYMYPVNPLENNEHGKFSVNPTNNIYYAPEFYMTIIDANHDSNISTVDYIKSLNDSSPVGEGTLADLKAANKATYKARQVSEATSNEFDVQNIEGNNKLIKAINDKFGSNESFANYEKLIVWSNNAGMAKFMENHKNGLVQTILDKDGNPKSYYIRRVRLNSKVWSLRNKIVNNKLTEKDIASIPNWWKDTVTELSRNANAVNNNQNGYYEVVPAFTEDFDESIDENSPIMSSDISGVMTDSPHTTDRLTEVGKAIYTDIRERSNFKHDDRATTVINTLRKRGIDVTSTTNFNKDINTVFKQAADYVDFTVKSILHDIDNFGIYDISINDVSIPERLQNKAFRREYIDFILNANNFARNYEDIMNLDISSEEPELQAAIDKIRRNISALRANDKIKTAINLVMRDWVAVEISTDPRIKQGIKEITDQYGDADVLDWYFSDIAELDNSMVQNIVKFVLSNNYTDRALSEKRVREFRTALAEAKKKGNVDYNKFIKDGKFVTSYNEQYIIDYDALKDARDAAKEEFGEFSKEYYRVKLALDKFRADNVNQEYIQDYYKEVYANEEKFFRLAPDTFIKYKKLKAQLRDIRNNADGKLVGDALKEFNKINSRLKNLANPINFIDADEDAAIASTHAHAYMEEARRIEDKYFNKTEVDSFESNLKNNLAILNKYKGTDSFSNLINIPEYRDAYEWIADNTYTTYEEGFKKQYEEALKRLSESVDENESRRRKSILPKYGPEYYDDFGKLDARKLTAEQIAEYKEAQYRMWNLSYQPGQGDANLIRYSPKNQPVYSAAYYSQLRTSEEKANNPLRLKTINDINNILTQCIDLDNNEIHTSRLTIDQLKELKELYDRLRKLDGTRKKDKNKAKFLAENTESIIDNVAYNAERQLALQHGVGSEYYKVWLEVNAGYELDESGEYARNENTGNSMLYGYLKPDDRWIDKEKTEAIKFLNNNVAYVHSEYFTQEYMKAVRESKGAEWYEANTIVNPYTHKREPLRVWQERIIKNAPDGTERKVYKPNFNQLERTIKPIYINKRFVDEGFGYNEQNPKYNNNLGLNEAERETMSLFKNTIDELTNTYSGRKFINQGYLPRRRKAESTSIKTILGGLADISGFVANISGEQAWKDKVDYAHDTQPTMPMLELLKGKGYKQYKDIPNKLAEETDEQYAERIKPIKEENAKIKLANDEIDKNILDDNWDSVMEDFILAASDYNSRQEQKMYVYLLIDALRMNKAIKVGMFNNAKVDYARSFDDYTVYQEEDQTKTLDLVDTFAHRFIRGEYKKGHKFDRLGSTFQNIASAKYMMFNITGAIGNVTTGLNNIWMEAIAKQYFGASDWNKGERDYFSSVPSYFANFGTDKSSNLNGALVKLFDIVDFTRIVGKSIDTKNMTTSEIMNKFKDIAYSPQSMGEQYMQNAAMFAMLRSHKVYTNAEGKNIIGSFEEYTRDVEEKAMREVLSSNDELTKLYNNFIANIKSNKKDNIEYTRFRKTINNKFLKKFVSKDIANAYFKRRKELLKDAKERFNNMPSFYDQFTFNDGYAEFKPDALVGWDEFGTFKQKVISVNNKIHGVYNKIGAARIESEWWGGMVMQYHKHIYPGMMKRWRRKGMYNESRGSIEKGAYVSFIDFLGTEFADAHEELREETQGNYGEYLLKGIQRYIRAGVRTLTKAQFNWNALDEWERANVKRTLADMAATLSAVMFGIAMYVMNEDDEYEDNLLWNLAIYEADKLASESQMYTPWGFASEAKKLWSSPIAIQPSIQDLWKSTGLLFNMLVNGEEFDATYTTGRYKGRNKFEVYITRNIPVYRAFDRLTDLDKNNSYYKLGQNALGFIDIKGIAEDIND